MAAVLETEANCESWSSIKFYGVIMDADECCKLATTVVVSACDTIRSSSVSLHGSVLELFNKSFGFLSILGYKLVILDTNTSFMVAKCHSAVFTKNDKRVKNFGWVFTQHFDKWQLSSLISDSCQKKVFRLTFEYLSKDLKLERALR